MDFSLSSDQTAIADLARQIFRDQVSDSYLAAGPANPDPALWQILGDAGLIGVDLSETAGGSQMGFIAECLVLREMGEVLAPVPLAETLLAAGALDRAGMAGDLAPVSAGNAHLTLSLSPDLALDGEALSGELPFVPYAEGARQILAVAGDHLVAFSPSDTGATLTAQQATNGCPTASVTLSGVPAVIVGDRDAIAQLRQRQQVATASLQLGVAREALQRTAAYTTERKQFGRPIAAFQAVAHRAADGYIDIEALRATLDGAMWRLEQGEDATLQAGAARWWACQTSHRVSHTAQHLHGGIGADRDYPIHRFFLWSKQLEFALGGAGQHLAEMGTYLAEHPDFNAEP